MKNFWNQHYAQRTQRVTNSTIRELLKLTEQPDFISFAGGLPAPDVFPVEEVAIATEQVLREQGWRALQYSTTEGYRPLRQFIADQMVKQGVMASIDNILITSGSQQALDLLGKIFIDPDDGIVVEEATYLGALQAWNPYEARYVTVPVDEQGMVTTALEDILQTRPKFIYALPNFQNPAGVTLTVERRQQLVKVAHRYGIPIIEDDPYGQLRFEGEALPPIISLAETVNGDRSEPYRGSIIYLSTFSKTLVPGLRLAWVVAAPEVISKLVQVKQGADLHTATLNQMVAFEMIQDGFLSQHVPLIQQAYRERRDIMLAAMAEHFPSGIRWTRPEGGMFLWVTLPEAIDTTELLQMAIAEKVAFVPGGVFHPNGGGTHTLRLNFSNSTPANIRAGIARLGRVIQQNL